MKTENTHSNVAVLAGGIGSERDISLQSGNAIADALKKAGVNVILADISPDNLDILEDCSINVFFIALHGQFGEDGQLQQILEDRTLIYTGSGPSASRLAFDKIASKKAFAEAGIAIPAAIEYDANTDSKQLEQQLSEMANRYVVKPIRQGSSVGVYIADKPDEAVLAARKTLSEFGDCMIEEFIAGREITVGILGRKALPIIEIKTEENFYDYHAKYIDDRTKFLFNTIQDGQLENYIKTTAINCFDVLGLKGFGRIDFVLSEEQKPYILEANSIPGFTSHSLVPQAAAKAGLSMSDLCVRIIQAAIEDVPQKRMLSGKKLYTSY